MKNKCILLISLWLVAVPCFAASWNEKLCPNGIENVNQLVSINPYDVKGKCFRYMGPNTQLIGRTKALFGFYTSNTPFALIDFGKESTPMGVFSGIVKGRAPYVYQTVSGSVRTIFSFVNVPQSKESIKYQAEIEAEKRLIAIQERATKEEQERIYKEEKLSREKDEYAKAKEDGEERARQEFHRKRLDEFGVNE